MKNRTDNSLLELLGGKIGLTKSNGRIVMHVIKSRKRIQPTDKQRDQNRKFVVAAAYAKGQMCDAERKAVYQKGITKMKQTAYLVAMSDALTAPVVHEIDTSNYTGAGGDIISIKATDDFKVVRVKVVIKNQNCTEIGEASLQDNYPFRWNYSPRVLHRDLEGIKIAVTAFDNPGNEGTLEKVLEKSDRERVRVLNKSNASTTQPSKSSNTKSKRS